MALSKITIGDYVKLVSQRCGVSNLTINDVSGINRDKEFFEPSKQVSGDTSNYKVVPFGCFACNLMHIGRDVVLPVALNTSGMDKVVSPAYTVFKVTDERIIMKEFLFLLLKSTEKDRYFWFHCDSSVRDGMDWNSFCEIELEIPSIDIQRKYVAIYESMLANLHTYEKGLDDLKLICDGLTEKLRRKHPSNLTGLLFESDLRNSNGIATLEKGVSINKVFIDTKAKSSDITSQKIVYKDWFAFNSNTSRNSDTISIALNREEPYAVSNTYVVFKCDKTIVPEYLYLWFKRKEFDRFARFNSWGSARETISLDDFKDYLVSIPDIEEQECIVAILKQLEQRRLVLTRLKKKISFICPVLVQGAIQEVEGGEQHA